MIRNDGIHNHIWPFAQVMPEWGPFLCYHLFWGFVHAYNRITRIKRTLVDVQHHFHVCNKATILICGIIHSSCCHGLISFFLKCDVPFHEKCYQYS